MIILTLLALKNISACIQVGLLVKPVFYHVLGLEKNVVLIILWILHATCRELISREI